MVDGGWTGDNLCLPCSSVLGSCWPGLLSQEQQEFSLSVQVSFGLVPSEELVPSEGLVSPLGWWAAISSLSHDVFSSFMDLCSHVFP